MEDNAKKIFYVEAALVAVVVEPVEAPVVSVVAPELPPPELPPQNYPPPELTPVFTFN